MATLLLAFTPDGGEASLRLLWHATLLAGTTLIALLLLVPKKTGAVTELPADPAFTLREDNGVTKVCPVHTGRAKKDEPPILEGTCQNDALVAGAVDLPEGDGSLKRESDANQLAASAFRIARAVLEGGGQVGDTSGYGNCRRSKS